MPIMPQVDIFHPNLVNIPSIHERKGWSDLFSHDKHLQTPALASPLTTRTTSKSTTVQYTTTKCEALIIGCGVAGNAAALRLANEGIHVTMISAADNPHYSATYYAQGGIIYKSHDDTPELLASDVQRAGVGICDPDAVHKLAVDGPKCVEQLLLEVSKVPFTRDLNGELSLTLEASHNRARILYKADHTGQAITKSMVAAVQAHENITLLSNRSAFQLVTNDNGECNGVLTVTSSDEIEFYASSFTLLATGGMGDIYTHTSNPDGARGEGVGLAARAGAKLKNMQYMQFHPTTLYVPNERRFLLTEALRGEGAILRDRQGRAFAKDYNPAGELAPRDVVARLILAEMAKQNEPCMFLDISHKPAEWIKTRFPTIYQHCLDRGMDMTKVPVPIVPAAHYHCGGVEVDLNGCTSIPGLYASGEVSCTGVHGANRLASTSLLEGLVWGCSASDHFLAQRANGRAVSLQKDVEDLLNNDVLRMLYSRSDVASTNEIEKVMTTIRQVMWDFVGPVRTKTGMRTAISRLEQLESEVSRIFEEYQITRATAGLYNAIRAAKDIAIAASNASKSIGTHYVVEESTV